MSDQITGVRVFALAGEAKDGVMEYFGLGSMVGREPVADTGLTTPVIRLDNGETVYGYECWWGPVGQEKMDSVTRAINDGSVPSRQITVASYRERLDDDD